MSEWELFLPFEDIKELGEVLDEMKLSAAQGSGARFTFDLSEEAVLIGAWLNLRRRLYKTKGENFSALDMLRKMSKRKRLAEAREWFRWRLDMAAKVDIEGIRNAKCPMGWRPGDFQRKDNAYLDRYTKKRRPKDRIVCLKAAGRHPQR